MPRRKYPNRSFMNSILTSLALLVAMLAAGPSVAGTPVNSGADAERENAPGLVPSVAQSRPVMAEEPAPGKGFVPPPFYLPSVDAPAPGISLPLVARFDWRETGKVTSVKNQGACGSCYAFASAATLESKLLIDDEGTFDFSENNIKECDYYGSSCGGGNFWRVANLLSTRGTVLEACDPYVASDVTCKGTCAYAATLLDWREFSHDAIPDVATIKAYLQTYGPIYTAMNAGHGDAWDTEFGHYDGSYTLYCGATGTSNHAVLIVGWDDNLTHADGQGAWIVKNSWGTSWGGACGYGTERGYFTLAYGSANIGSWASFLSTWQAYDTDGSLLYYDEAGYTNSVGYGTTTAWGFCKSIPVDDVILKRVEFWTCDATPDVDVYIYDNFNGTSLSNLIASKLNSSFDLPGYHSVEIASVPRVSSGNDVYVVVKITDASYKYPLTYDSVGPRSAATSYISSNGSSWSEWTPGDLGIRLRVTKDGVCSVVTEKPALVSVRDLPGDNGGHVRLTWKRSAYDDEGTSPEIKRYKIWRKRTEVLYSTLSLGGGMQESDVPATPRGPYEHGETGAAWELVGVVPASGACNYTFDAHTSCDSSSGDACWTKFYISAHTGRVGQHYDSPVDSGYSVDNLLAVDNGCREGKPVPDVPDEGGVRVTHLEVPEPNPGAGGFVIRYDIGTSGWVRLDVYDIAGRRVAMLVDGDTDAGRHVARWDSRMADQSCVAPGMYFVRLMTRTETHTAKLVLVR